jgi:hypothetical protein
LSAFSNYKRINSNKYNKQNWIWEKKRKRSMVPVGVSNRYQWKPKPPVDKPGVLRRGYWSRGTGWETGSFGPSQPVLKACFLVVLARLAAKNAITF